MYNEQNLSWLRKIFRRYFTATFSVFSHHLPKKNYFSYEEININLVEKPEWYLKKNPPGLVPSLEWIDSNSKETHFIPESLVTCDYLDEFYPEHRLQPQDPYVKATQRVLIERFGSVSDNRH